MRGRELKHFTQRRDVRNEGKGNFDGINGIGEGN